MARDPAGARPGSAIRYVPEAHAFVRWGFMNDDPELLQEQPLMRVPEYDMVAFDFCLEEPASGTVSGVTYELDGQGGIRLDPWPLVPAELDGFVTAFLTEGYPELPAPVAVRFSARPA